MPKGVQQANIVFDMAAVAMSSGIEDDISESNSISIH